MSRTLDMPDVETEAGPLIYAAMNAILSDVKAIGKDSRNQAQGFDFRGIDAVYNALHGLMAKHGVFTTSQILDISRTERISKAGATLLYTCLTMQYTFHALDGSSVATTVLGEGMDSGDKASNKAMAVAHKYALLQAFMVPTEDMVDPDSETYELQAAPEIATAEQIIALHDYRDAGQMTEGQVAWLSAAENKITKDQADYVLSKLREAK